MGFCCCDICFFKGAYSLFLLSYFFAILIFNGRWAKGKVFFRKTCWMRSCYLKKTFAKVSFRYLNKTDKGNCLRRVSDSKTLI